jgi:hypothetical protein
LELQNIPNSILTKPQLVQASTKRNSLQLLSMKPMPK